MSKPEVVDLQFKRLDDPRGSLLVQVVDTVTGEICIVQSIPHIASWLKNLGYQYVVGSNGRWALGADAPANIVPLKS